MCASLSRHSSTSIEAFPCLVYCQANLDGHCPLDSIEAKQVSGRQSHEWASQPCVYLFINSCTEEECKRRKKCCSPPHVSEWGPKPTLPESNDVFLCWVTHDCHWRNNDHTLGQTGTWLVPSHTSSWIVLDHTSRWIVLDHTDVHNWAYHPWLYRTQPHQGPHVMMQNHASLLFHRASQSASQLGKQYCFWYRFAMLASCYKS